MVSPQHSLDRGAPDARGDASPGVASGFTGGARVPFGSRSAVCGDLLDEVPLAALFDPPLQLLDPDAVSDAVLDAGFRSLLARLAGKWVAFDVCEHFTIRDAYRLLLRSLADGRTTIPRVRERGSIERFLTHDRCVHCIEEIGGFWPGAARMAED